MEVILYANVDGGNHGSFCGGSVDPLNHTEGPIVSRTQDHSGVLSEYY